MVLSVVFTISTTLMAGPLLQLIHTPEELYADAVLYIRILFLGIPATVLYNYASSVLRAMGDSQHPFYFLLAASVLNIGLDYLLIVSMGMGVDGAALATVLSQLLSGGLCAFWFFTRTAKQEELTFRGQSSLLSAGHCKRLAYIGFPMGFEYSVSAIGAVIMQDAINLLGSTAVAAQTAGEKIRQMFTLPMESVGMAMATYVGQNHGAHRTDRIKQGIKDGCTIQLTYCVAAWVVIFFVKPYAVCLASVPTTPAALSLTASVWVAMPMPVSCSRLTTSPRRLFLSSPSMPATSSASTSTVSRSPNSSAILTSTISRRAPSATIVG